MNIDSTRYLVDTNVLIRGAKGIEPVASFLWETIQKKKVFLSTIVISEYLAGATIKEEENFEKLINKLPILVVDLHIARVAARYRKQRVFKTSRTYLVDCLIAATAKVHNLILITSNIKDFPMRDIKIIDPMTILPKQGSFIVK